MGYSHYVLPDGREAGYAVEAECDAPDCHTIIDRGLAYLRGLNPAGHKEPGEWGCGNDHCPDHYSDHDCPNPDGYDPDEDDRDE